MVIKPLKKLTEVDGGSSGHMEIDRSFLNVSRPHGMLTQIDGRSSGCIESGRMWTEVLPAVLKVDQISQISQPHGKLQKVFGRFTSRKKIDGC